MSRSTNRLKIDRGRPSICRTVLITRLFVEQPLALPRSAKNQRSHITNHTSHIMHHTFHIRKLTLWGLVGAIEHFSYLSFRNATTKSLPFQNKIFRQKIYPTLPYSTLFLKYWPKPSKKIEWKYVHSHSKSAFRINFRPWEVGKLKIRKYLYLRICNWFQNQIWNENIYISILIFVCKDFQSIFFKIKKLISHHILKSDLTGVGYTFWQGAT